MDTADLYAKIEQLVKNTAHQEAVNVYKDLGTRYNVASVPAHTHNGVDSNQIPAKHMIQGEKYTSLLVQDTTESVTIGGIFNPSRISFNGFAANNADGSPATKRAVLTGAIEFGSCLTFSDLTPPYTVTTSGPGNPFLQYCNSMYVDSSDLTKNRVSTSQGAGTSGSPPPQFIYSLDDTGTVFASATATSYNNQLGIISISFVVGTNVKIQGALVIT